MNISEWNQDSSEENCLSNWQEKKNEDVLESSDLSDDENEHNSEPADHRPKRKFSNQNLVQ